MAQRQSGQFSPVTASRRKSTPGFSTLSLSRGLDSNISPVQGSSPLGASPYGSPARRRQSAHPGAHDSPGSPGRAARRKSCQSVGNWMDGAPEEAGDQNVQVMLRVRPFNKRELRIHEEKSDGYLRSIIEMPDGVQAGVVHFLEKISGQDDYAVAEEFQFDKCFWSIPLEDHPYKHAFCSQETVYEHVGAPALKNAWNGFNTCIFAYGQTGAGKTHTMMGPFTFEGHSAEISGTPGVIPQLCKALYLSIEAKRKEQEESEFKVIRTKYETELSAYEIYNERVRDLFFNHTPGREPGEELKVRKHPVEGPFVDKISKLNPERWQDCLSMIVEGNEKRTVGATAMNADSSRSHSVFQIKFTQVETSVPKDKFEKPVTNRKYSIINLIDLAGSERNKKSQATGERLVEASNINLSLTTLKRVIDALVYNSQHRSAPKQVPYRDSVLTMLLSHSLGGNSKTMMVACVSPHYDNADETLNTLRYASAARKIVNVVQRNEDSAAKQNLALKDQLEKMQAALEGGGQTAEEIEELEDMVRIGQEELKRQMEEVQAAEEVRERLRKEKEGEEQKRYQAAYQHSFQMVVLRRQKEAAVRKAKEVTGLREEAEKAKRALAELEQAHVEVVQLKEKTAAQREYVQLYERQLKEAIEHERKHREEVMKKAFGLQYVEQQRRQMEQRSHEQELKEVIHQAAQQEKELSEAYAEQEQALRTNVDRLRRHAKKLEQRLEKRKEEARQIRRQGAELAEANLRELREKDNAGGFKIHKAEVQVESLRREAEDHRQAQARLGDLVRAQTDEHLMRLEREGNRRYESAVQDWRERQQRAALEREGELSSAYREHGAQRDAQLAEFVAALKQQQRAVEELEARCAEQARVLRDSARKEAAFSEGAGAISEALGRTHAEDMQQGLPADLCALLQQLRASAAHTLVSTPVASHAGAQERAQSPRPVQRKDSLPHAEITTDGGMVLMPMSPRRRSAAGTTPSPAPSKGKRRPSPSPAQLHAGSGARRQRSPAAPPRGELGGAQRKTRRKSPSPVPRRQAPAPKAASAKRAAP